MRHVASGEESRLHNQIAELERKATQLQSALRHPPKVMASTTTWRTTNDSVLSAGRGDVFDDEGPG